MHKEVTQGMSGLIAKLSEEAVALREGVGLKRKRLRNSKAFVVLIGNLRQRLVISVNVGSAEDKPAAHVGTPIYINIGLAKSIDTHLFSRIEL